MLSKHHSNHAYNNDVTRTLYSMIIQCITLAITCFPQTLQSTIPFNFNFVMIISIQNVSSRACFDADVTKSQYAKQTDHTTSRICFQIARITKAVVTEMP